MTDSDREFLDGLAARAKELARQAQLIEADIERFKLMADQRGQAAQSPAMHTALGDHVPVYGPDPRPPRNP